MIDTNQVTTANDLGLPISVNVKSLFDTSDHKTAAMLERVNAWINFQALGANWFCDESKITTIDITLFPESTFLKLPELSDPNWSKVLNGGFTGIQKNNTDALSFVCIAAIANADIKEMMDNGQLVEQNLQQLSATICNYLTLNQSLARL